MKRPEKEWQQENDNKKFRRSQEREFMNEYHSKSVNEKDRQWMVRMDESKETVAGYILVLQKKEYSWKTLKRAKFATWKEHIHSQGQNEGQERDKKYKHSNGIQ